ncbi:MAG: light-regulated signal transduction histidine kinase (bacteriophytochrome) [Sphingobacteriales bacterium]
MGTYYGIQWRIKALTEKNQKLEEMVAERTFLLKLRNRDLEQFSYTLSHDLKNPAGNMIQLVDIIKETFDTTNEEDKEIIELLESSANGMHNKLLSFLEVIKNSQNAPAKISKFPIWDEVEKIREEFIPSLNTAKAKFTCTIPKDVQVEFNREKLISIFHNLISNSIKYRKKDEALVVQIRYNEAGDFHVFEVEDNGLGIDLQSQKEKLFGMFQRIHEHVEGTGVGLNLVKSILENNGGWIDVQSAKGMGSTFFIGIPVVAKVLSPIE